MDYLFGKRIAFLQKKADIFINESLHPYSINRSQMELLFMLKHHSGCSQAQLNEHKSFNKGSITKMLCSLEKSGYIKRHTCSEDKRKNEVYLTQKAKDIFPVLLNVISEWDAKITKDLSIEEQSELKALLEKVNNSILKESKVTE